MLKIDTKQIEKLELELRNMHKSALPNVVRNTLNDLAFDVKKTTLKEVTNKEFTVRSKNFFKANSGVEKATGWSVTQMESTVGMLKKDTATANLEQQEKGGQIMKRSFIPMDTARTGKNHKKKVGKRNRMSNIRFVDSRYHWTKKNRMMAAAAKAKQLNKFLLHNDTVFRVSKFYRKGRNSRFKITPLYSYEKGRSVKVEGTNFMQKSSLESIKKLDSLYKKNFNKQVDKLKKSGKL